MERGGREAVMQKLISCGKELLIYAGVIHPVNYMHVLLSCKKE